jgi:hypothetical protein
MQYHGLRQLLVKPNPEAKGRASNRVLAIVSPHVLPLPTPRTAEPLPLPMGGPALLPKAAGGYLPRARARTSERAREGEGEGEGEGGEGRREKGRDGGTEGDV